MPVGHVTLVTLLALEVDLALVALEQAHVVHLPTWQCYTRSTITAAGHLVLVPVPVRPAGGQLAAQLARAAPVLVDEVVQGHVGARRRLLPVSDDQGSVNICSAQYINRMVGCTDPSIDYLFYLFRKIKSDRASVSAQITIYNFTMCF